MSHTTEVKTVPIRDIRALKAAVKELQKEGVKVTLKEKAVPRMYYTDQLKKHMGRKDEVCDYVIAVEDAYYDIGIIKNDDGTYSPVFDDYNSSSPFVPSSKGRGPIRNFLGAKFQGEVKHWSGRRDDTEQTLHSIGKLLQKYTKHAAINAATAKGYRVEGCTLDKQGNIQLRLGV